MEWWAWSGWHGPFDIRFTIRLKLCVCASCHGRMYVSDDYFNSPTYCRAFLSLFPSASAKLTLMHVFFVSRLLEPRVCGRQEEKKNEKHTEDERVQFLGTTEHERGPYTHATRKKHTLNTRGCSFGVPLNTRGGLTRTPHGKNPH